MHRSRRAYVVSARVSGGITGDPLYSPPTHLVILVQPSANDNQTYVVDVGFGSCGITRPLLLSAHPENVNYGLSETERHRITYSPSVVSSLGESITTPPAHLRMQLQHCILSFSPLSIFCRDFRLSMECGDMAQETRTIRGGLAPAIFFHRSGVLVAGYPLCFLRCLNTARPDQYFLE